MTTTMTPTASMPVLQRAPQRKPAISRLRPLVLVTTLFLLLTALTGPSAAGHTPAAEPRPHPRLNDIRAAHHPGFDRIVFEFSGGLPSQQVGYVPSLSHDGSGAPVRIAGRGILRARFSPAGAHDASGSATVPGRRTYALPNLLTTVRAGDVEGVVTYGIGLAKATAVHVSTLRAPARVVIDVRAGFANRDRRVRFVDSAAVLHNDPAFIVPRARPVRADRPVVGLLDRLFAGVLPGEHASGLRLVRSEATGFRRIGVSDGIARIQLLGGCDSGGQPVTVADEIFRTLRPLPKVTWIKIYDPDGHTERVSGERDSIPTCIRP